MTVPCELRGVSKSFGAKEVLRDLDLAVAAGEMVAITGPSGSGKTTILNLLGLLEAPDAGEVRLLGAPAPQPRSRGAQQYLRHHLGYLFQNFALVDADTVQQNLDLALTYAPRAGDRSAQVDAALRFVGLNGAQGRRVATLSGGEQQRVAIARLLLKPCEIVLADEPTGSLDADNRDIVLTLLRDMNRAGKTIVVVTHDPVVVAACDRAVTLSAPATLAGV